MALLMIPQQTTHILARLELGLRTDSSRLIEPESDLIPLLRRARGLADEYGSPGDWNTAWRHHWDRVEANLLRIHHLVNEISTAIASSENARQTIALEAWTTLQAENAELAQTLGALRGQAIGLHVEAQNEWNTTAHKLEAHLETIDACSKSLRIKLELLKKYSKEEMDQLVQDLLTKLPNRSLTASVDAASYEHEYQQAAAELEQEHHKFQGVMDVIKGLFMWVETTEERTDKKMALAEDQTSTSDAD